MESDSLVAHRILCLVPEVNFECCRALHVRYVVTVNNAGQVNAYKKPALYGRHTTKKIVVC